MNEIAEKAEFAVGTLYKFFDSKENIYLSMLSGLSTDFHDSFIKVLTSEADEIETLRNFVKILRREFMRNAGILRLYFAETRGMSFNLKADLNIDIRRQYDETLDMVAAVFERGARKKIFTTFSSPYHLSVALVSICDAFLFLWLEDPERHPYPGDPDVILDILFKGALA